MALRDELEGVRDSEEETFAGILMLIQWVENASNIHLSIPERRSLGIALLRTGETLDELKTRARAVVSAEKFGRLGFDLWMKSEPLYTAAEVKLKVEEEIRRRRRLYEASLEGKRPWTEEEMLRAGLGDLTTYFAGLFNAEKEALVEDRKARVQKALEWAHTLSPTGRMMLRATLAETDMGVMDDKFWWQGLRLRISENLERVEKLM